MPVLLIVIIIGFVLYAVAQYGKRKAIEARRSKLLAWAQPYVKDQCFISVDASSLIGFNFQEKEIFLACVESSGKYRFDEIASCELLRDDVSLTQTNRGSQVLGAVVGDVLLGPAGALVGALSGSKRSRNRLAKLELKIVVDCQDNPVYRVVLFASEQKNGARLGDPRLRPHLATADRFMGISSTQCGTVISQGKPLFQIRSNSLGLSMDHNICGTCVNFLSLNRSAQFLSRNMKLSN